jgi:hypothetical protein
MFAPSALHCLSNQQIWEYEDIPIALSASSLPEGVKEILRTCVSVNQKNGQSWREYYSAPWIRFKWKEKDETDYGFLYIYRSPAPLEKT